MNILHNYNIKLKKTIMLKHKSNVILISGFIFKRTMFTSKHLGQRLIKTNIQKLAENPNLLKPYVNELDNKERHYACFAGKGKSTSNQTKIFSSVEQKELVNAHAQLVTDFNLIYDNPKEIRLYAIGTMITKPIGGSTELSPGQNYKFENKSQQVKFFNKPIEIQDKVYIIKKSRNYFDEPSIKKKLESADEYKVLFSHVLKELKVSQIKVRLAKDNDDILKTGYNVLLNTENIDNKNNFLDILILNKKE